MLLVVDVGNTAITLGVYEGDKLRATWNLATGLHRMVDEYASQLLFLMDHEGIKPADLRGIALCTVVPPLSRVFKEMFRRYFKLTPLVVAAGTRTGIKIRMDNPREVGADRVVNAVAAHHLYGGPVIVCDFGTATTFDTVSADGEYVGGAIAPGLLTSAEALYNRAASLPRVDLERPKRAIGTNTVDAMRSGIIFGYVGLVEGIVRRIQDELDSPARVIATGGHGETVARETEMIDEVNQDLTLIGLKLIYEMNTAQG
jgi:type III pantothenate kinase